MKAIILSAGQGSRLLPLTEGRPKCLLPIGPRTLIEWQIWALTQGGVDDIAVGKCTRRSPGFMADVDLAVEVPRSDDLQAVASQELWDDLLDGIAGHVRAHATADGRVLWDFDTARDYATVNGVAAKGGSLDGAGAVIVDGMVFVNSGYPRFGGLPGNVRRSACRSCSSRGWPAFPARRVDGPRSHGNPPELRSER